MTFLLMKDNTMQIFSEAGAIALIKQLLGETPNQSQRRSVAHAQYQHMLNVITSSTYANTPFLTEERIGLLINEGLNGHDLKTMAKPCAKIYFEGSYAGICARYNGRLGLSATILEDELNRFEIGQYVTTSEIIEIYNSGSELIVETRNTRYFVIFANSFGRKPNA
jgi:hypothetical protein